MVKKPYLCVFCPTDDRKRTDKVMGRNRLPICEKCVEKLKKKGR